MAPAARTGRKFGNLAVTVPHASGEALRNAADPSHEAVDPRGVLTSIGEVVYGWDMSSDQLSWGPNVGDVLFAAPSDCLKRGVAFSRLVEPGSGRSRYESIIESGEGDLGDGVPYRTRYILALNSKRVWVEDTGRWFAGSDGRPLRARGVLRLERSLRQDEIAGSGRELCDRSALVATLEATLAAELSGQRDVVLIVATIDELARLNDDFGHEATDEIICAVQDRLRSVMRQRDRLVRYSGNRFAITLIGCPGDEIEQAAERFMRAVSRNAIETSHGLALVKLRAAAAHAPALTRQAGVLLSCAELALTDARRSDGGRVIMARALDRRPVRTRDNTLDAEAVAALNDRRVALARQPVVRATDRGLAFHEALIRIERLDGGWFQPAELLPMLEQRGLVRLFDHRVLELVFARLDLDRQAVSSLNVSPQSLGDFEWITLFESLCRTRPNVPSRLIVEVTETAAITEPHRTRTLLERIKAEGARVAIDDFGAGHTSLRHLRDFPIDILKLDGAFTQNLERSTDDRFFVRTLLDLAQHLEVETVAEWVDTEAAATMLTGWGVTYLQGNLLGAAEFWPGNTAPQTAAAPALKRALRR
jgi:diguanylate cyclase (GGDEF)-like protein